MAVQVIVVQNNLPRIAARFLPAVDEIITLGLFKIHEAADVNTPVDTGDLKNNVQVTPSSGGHGGEIHWSMGYAGYVDKGTVHMAPRLFATNATNLVFPQIVQALGQIEGRL